MTEFLHGVKASEFPGASPAFKTPSSSTIGLIGTAPDADADKFPLNTPVAIFDPQQAAGLGDAGTLKWQLDGVYDQTKALSVIVRVEEGADETATYQNLVGDATAMTGIHALLAAENITKAKPRLLAAAGYTHQRPGGNANPLVAEMKGVASKLRAVGFVDGPSTDNAAAVTAAEEAGSDRLYCIDPFAQVFDPVTGGNIPQPTSARLAGVQARVDAKKGWWYSLSNNDINGIVGTSRPIDYQINSAANSAGFLNERKVGTIIFRNGYKVWGNYGTGSNPDTQFLSSRRINDIIADGFEETIVELVDVNNINGNTLTHLQSALSAKMRFYESLGAVVGSRVVLDPALNSVENLAAGNVYMNIEKANTVPMQAVFIGLFSNNVFYEEVFQQAA